MKQAINQSRAFSLLESLANVVAGFGITLLAQIVIYPWFGIQVDLQTNFQIGCCFTVVSIGRSYLLRRMFNRFVR